MYQNVKTNKAKTNYGAAMETGDHFKNGASLKSHTSRGNFLRKACFALFATSIIFCGCKKNNENNDDEWLSKDVLERVPEEVLNKAKELGLEINGGKTPPNIEGTYNAKPVILVNSTDEDDKSRIGSEFNNGTFVFSEQDNVKLTVLTYIEEMGVGSDTGVGSFITGNTNKFSVFVVMPDMYSETVYFFISGKIENGGIRDLHFLLLRENLWGRLFKAGDGLAERSTPTKSSAQKNNKIYSETLKSFLSSTWF